MQRNFDPQSAKDIILGGGLKEGGVPGWVRTEASNTGEITTICNNKLEFLARGAEEGGYPCLSQPRGYFFYCATARHQSATVRTRPPKPFFSFFLSSPFLLSFLQEGNPYLGQDSSANVWIITKEISLFLIFFFWRHVSFLVV